MIPKKNSLFPRPLLWALASIVMPCSAADILALFSLQMPTDIDIQRNEKGVELESSFRSGITWNFGLEYLKSTEFGPFQYGAGIGFMSAQEDSKDGELTPYTMPLWASVAVIAKDKEWIAYPYAETRLGYLLPISVNGNWWARPLNFMVSVNLGVRTTYYVGLEASYTLVSMEKYYPSSNLSLRTFSGRFGFSITGPFNLSWDRAFEDTDFEDMVEDEE